MDNNIYGQCLRCGKNLTNNHVCDLIDQPEKKNSGLTLSEVFQDDDILEAKRSTYQPFKKADLDPKFLTTSIEDVIATDWVVLKRKSDEKKENTIITTLPYSFLEEQNKQLQKENAELREQRENSFSANLKLFHEVEELKAELDQRNNDEGKILAIKEILFMDKL